MTCIDCSFPIAPRPFMIKNRKRTPTFSQERLWLHHSWITTMITGITTSLCSSRHKAMEVKGRSAFRPTRSLIRAKCSSVRITCHHSQQSPSSLNHPLKRTVLSPLAGKKTCSRETDAIPVCLLITAALL